MKQSLYQITTRYQQALDDFADMEDIDEQTKLDTLESIEGEISVKAENYAAYSLNLDAQVKAIKAAEKRMRLRRTRLAKRSGQLKQYLLDNMVRCGIKKISATSGEFSVKLGDCPVSVDEDNLDMDLLPKEYKRHIPESWEPDKNKVKEDIKKGVVVPGAKLIQNKKLIIK